MFVVKKIVALFFYPVGSLPGDLDPGTILPLGHPEAAAGQGVGDSGDRAPAPVEYCHSYPQGYWFPWNNAIRLSCILRPSPGGTQSSTSPKWIVVLGGGHVSDPRLPANSQISAAALGRVVEGVRLHKAIPGSKLLLSGGAVFDPVPEAEVMARIAVLLGVKPQDIRLETRLPGHRR